MLKDEETMTFLRNISLRDMKYSNVSQQDFALETELTASVRTEQIRILRSKTQAIQHGCLPSLLGNGDKGLK